MAVLQSQLFRCELLALAEGDWNRRRIGTRKDLQRRAVNLDVACLHFLIPHLGGAELDAPRNLDDSFLSQSGGIRDEIGRCPARIEGNLHEAGPVAKVHEDESTKIPDAVNPPTEGYLLPSVGGAKLTAKVRAL